MSVVIGIDCGLTVTKAAIYDTSAKLLGQACLSSPHATPQPRWVERDMEKLWDTCAEAIQQALANSGRSSAEVLCVGVTGHGDGLYCITESGEPARPGISSLDTRSRDQVARWESNGVGSRCLALTGQVPFPASPASILAWLAEKEPATLARTRWIFQCKDWVRFKLTGQASTDQTEASESFTNVATQDYDPAILELLSLSDYGQLLPRIWGSAEVAGTVEPEAARQTGLPVGTPVVAGLHDVDACALGSGCIRPGQLSIVAGSYSINQVMASAPRTDSRWYARNSPISGLWMHMGISPASATNLEWFLHELCPDIVAEAVREQRSPYDDLSAAYAEVDGDPSDIVYLPYLYGAPGDVRTDAAFVGVQGWHRREHLLRAVLEGVVFNHRKHVDALRDHFEVTETRLTGGASRAPHWAQMFADALGLPVHVGQAPEPGTLGVALCALVGAEVFPDLTTAVASLPEETVVLEPDADRGARLERSYRRFLRVSDALSAAAEG